MRTRIVNVITAILCALQMLAIAFVAVFILAESGRTVPGRVLILVVPGILAATALSLYFLRRTLRRLGIGQPSLPEDEWGLAIANLLAGLAMTAMAAQMAIMALMASVSQSPPGYYLALMGGIWFSLFTFCSWSWWGGIVLGQVLLRAGRKGYAFVVALFLPPVLFSAGIEILLSYRFFL